MRNDKDPTKNVACLERRFLLGRADPDLASCWGSSSNVDRSTVSSFTAMTQPRTRTQS